MREYLPKLRGKHRAWSIVFFSAFVLWTIGPLVLWTITRPSVVWMLTVGFPIQYAGMLVLALGSVAALYLLRSPLRTRAGELRTAENAVFCITLDPLWLPIGRSSDVALGPGFLVADRDGIRIVDDSNGEILAANWDEADVRSSRAPKPIGEIQLSRGGEVTQWWFYVLGPGAFLRRKRHGIDRFVKQVDEFRRTAG